VNKNVYLKGRLGADGVALMAAFKSWFQPSLTLAGVVERSFDTGKTRTGLTIQVRIESVVLVGVSFCVRCKVLKTTRVQGPCSGVGKQVPYSTGDSVNQQVMRLDAAVYSPSDAEWL